MVCEEIDIDCQCQYVLQLEWWEVVKLEIEYLLYMCQIGFDCGVYEIGKQWYVGDLQEIFFWIDLVICIGFEDFYCCVDYVKDSDDFCFFLIF